MNDTDASVSEESKRNDKKDSEKNDREKNGYAYWSARRKISEARLRQAVETSGMTLYRIAKDSGIAYQVLHRFARGERDLTLETASRLADYFGVRLTRPRRPKKGG